MAGQDLTTGNIPYRLAAFAVPMMLGNLLQQVYNFADTFIVGRFVGDAALAAVGGTYSLTTFLYSIVIGLCMGCGAIVSFCAGRNDRESMVKFMDISFLITGAAAVLIEALSLIFSTQIMGILNTPADIRQMTHEYMCIVLAGFVAVFIYNYFSFVLRGMGNSVTPLVFLGIASVLNIFLDIVLVVYCGMGVSGAAYATLISQIFSGAGLAAYSVHSMPYLMKKESHRRFGADDVRFVMQQSGASCMQQSVMNFGILMIQGLVNSFGTVVMAAFSVAVKIDTIAYMPAQEFGNAYSFFISQNLGAGKHGRIVTGTKQSYIFSGIFCALMSALIFVFAESLMSIFVSDAGSGVIPVGARYLRIEGALYIGIGFLFLFYGFFRGMQKPMVSLLLTVISLGTRVLLAYALSPVFGVTAIWCAIPIGWFLADLSGYMLMRRMLGGRQNQMQEQEIN